MPEMPRTFRPRGQASRPEQLKAYDQRRGSARARGYSRAWDKAATAYKRAHPFCVGCMAVGRFEAVAVVDHVEPHKGDRAKFWDSTNWQSACAWHHSVVKQKLEALFASGGCTAADLRLDSRRAIRLTRDLGRG
jgi:5-methylcytosine-specific restriction endonuclease McrA